MISKRELKEQRAMQMLIDIQGMGDDLVAAIEKADYKNVERFKMPTDHMARAVEKWKAYWVKK